MFFTGSIPDYSTLLIKKPMVTLFSFSPLHKELVVAAEACATDFSGVVEGVDTTSCENGWYVAVFCVLEEACRFYTDLFYVNNGVVTGHASAIDVAVELSASV